MFVIWNHQVTWALVMLGNLKMYRLLSLHGEKCQWYQASGYVGECFDSSVKWWWIRCVFLLLAGWGHHFATFLTEFQDFLDTSFPGQWIGHAKPIAWPPRSSDWACKDFFLWGFIKELVYVLPLADYLAGIINRFYSAVAEMKVHFGITSGARNYFLMESFPDHLQQSHKT